MRWPPANQTFRGTAMPRWLRHGGLQTVASFGVGDVPDRSDTAGLAAFADRLRGAMGDDLDQAIADALTRDRAACAAFGAQFSWEAATAQFLAGLEEFDGESLTP